MPIKTMRRFIPTVKTGGFHGAFGVKKEAVFLKPPPPLKFTIKN
jgi:hypothetical protein